MSFILLTGKKKKVIQSTKPSSSYFSDGLQQTEVDVDETVKVFIGEPEAFHIKLQLTIISNVRDLLGQNVTAEDQGVVLHKVLIQEPLSWNAKTKITRWLS